MKTKNAAPVYSQHACCGIDVQGCKLRVWLAIVSLNHGQLLQLHR